VRRVGCRGLGCAPFAFRADERRRFGPVAFAMVLAWLLRKTDVKAWRVCPSAAFVEEKGTKGPPGTTHKRTSTQPRQVTNATSDDVRRFASSRRGLSFIMESKHEGFLESRNRLDSLSDRCRDATHNVIDVRVHLYLRLRRAYVTKEVDHFNRLINYDGLRVLYPGTTLTFPK
jgi:hypothetical protein